MSKGDTASGSIEMIMNMPDMPNMPEGMPAGSMKTTTSREEKRIGACD